MLHGTSWVKRSQPESPSPPGTRTLQTMKFEITETTQTTTVQTTVQTFHFEQTITSKQNKVDIIQYSGVWEMTGSIEACNEQLHFNVREINIQHNDDNNDDMSAVGSLNNIYRYDLETYMAQNRREQSQIRRAVNTQQVQVEKNEMDLGRPGYDLLLRQQAILAKHKVTPRPVVTEAMQIAHNCNCNKSDDDGSDPIWWCLQCKATECQQCTKKTCWLGMDYDHDDVEAKIAGELAEIERKKVVAVSCRIDFDDKNPLGGRPHYYVIDLIDYKAEWKILSSSTVKQKF